MLEVQVFSQSEESLIVSSADTKVGGKLGTGQILADSMYLSIRPERILLHNEPHSANFSLSGIVQETIFVGSFVKTVIRLATGDQIFALSPSQGNLTYQTGEQVWVSWREEDGIVIGA